MTTLKLGVCDWCRRIIKPDASKVQTSAVDWADALGGARLVASKVRTFHTPDCYREHMAWVREHGSNGDMPDARAHAIRDEVAEGVVPEDTFAWGDAFGMTAEQVLSGNGKTGAHRNYRKAG